MYIYYNTKTKELAEEMDGSYLTTLDKKVEDIIREKYKKEICKKK